MGSGTDRGARDDKFAGGNLVLLVNPHLVEPGAGLVLVRPFRSIS